MPIKCKTVTIKVISEGHTQEVTIPAYTRSWNDMKVQLDGLVAEYLDLSRSADEPVSLGDFALFAVSQAAEEPLYL